VAERLQEEMAPSAASSEAILEETAGDAVSGDTEFADLQQTSIWNSTEWVQGSVSFMSQSVPLQMQPLATADLRFPDNDRQESFAALKCAGADGGQLCKIMRNGVTRVLVLDSDTILLLSVQRLRCAVHCVDFQTTTPEGFAQLMAQGRRCEPSIIVFSSKVIVTEQAYRCALMSTCKLLACTYTASHARQLKAETNSPHVLQRTGACIIARHRKLVMVCRTVY
jgi:hypothetical protein